MLYEKHRGRPSLFEVPYGFKNLWDITVTSYNLATKSFLASDITAISLNGELVSGGQLRYLFDYNRDGCTLSQSGGDGLYVTLTQYDKDTDEYGFRVLVDQNIEITGILGISGDMVNNANPNWPIIEHDDSKLDKAQYDADLTAIGGALDELDSGKVDRMQYDADQVALAEMLDELASLPIASTATPGIVQLENSLTSDDETKALTAAQGKILYEEINESKESLVNTRYDQTVGGKKSFEEQLAVPGKTELPENASTTEYATEAQVSSLKANLVPQSRKINNISLDADITLTNNDISGSVKTVNGKSPDLNGDISVSTGGGSGTVKSVNAIDPDEDGNITLTAADIPMAGAGSASVGESIEALDTIVAEHADTLKATGPGQVLASTETEPGVYAARMRALELDDLLLPGAGPHNSIFRGKYLGDALTAAQAAAIASGTFDDLYIGDYWTIGGVNYRIGEFDRYLNCGDTPTTQHHATLVPDAPLYSATMNDTSVTTGGYMGSKMYTANLAQAKATITAAFPGHIMTHRQYLTNAVTNGRPSGGVWADSSVELMNEPMVYGGYMFVPANDGTNIPNIYTIDRSQLPLFAMRPDLVSIREGYWLRDVVSGPYFSYVHASGNTATNGAGLSLGVRTAFSIIG